MPPETRRPAETGGGQGTRAHKGRRTASTAAKSSQSEELSLMNVCVCECVCGLGRFRTAEISTVLML